MKSYLVSVIRVTTDVTRIALEAESEEAARDTAEDIAEGDDVEWEEIGVGNCIATHVEQESP